IVNGKSRMASGEQQEIRASLSSLLAFLLSRIARHLGQEYRKQPDRRQERADLIDKGDRCMVGELAEDSGAQATNAEGDAEEHTRDHAEAMRHQFLCEYDDRGRRGG